MPRIIDHRAWNWLNLSLEEKVQRLSVNQVEAIEEALLDFSGEPDLVTWLAQCQN